MHVRMGGQGLWGVEGRIAMLVASRLPSLPPSGIINRHARLRTTAQIYMHDKIGSNSEGWFK